MSAPLLLAAARGAVNRRSGGLPGERMGHLARVPDRRWQWLGRLMIAERIVSHATTGVQLRMAADSVGSLSTDDGETAQRFAVLGRIVEALAVQHDSLVAGAPQGDMLTFVHAELARDSLRAPDLASYFLARLEREWPASPYMVKALLARIARALWPTRSGRASHSILTARTSRFSRVATIRGSRSSKWRW